MSLPLIVTTDIQEKEGLVDMYVGACPRPFATLMRSNGGKRWSVLLDMPQVREIKTYDTLANQMVAATGNLHDFFTLATSLPDSLKS